jgi:Outer membrane cobalamin receptor protein
LVAVIDSWAEEEEISIATHTLGEIIVTATKTEIYPGEVGSSTTVVTADEIEKSGKRTVVEVLRDIPGVAVAQNGALGGLASVYLRGADAGQTLVMIDGVEVNDPMSTDRSFDFAHLTTDNIERIEVVRGPQSTLYGSDAMAGVINIITKKGTGKPTVDASFEGGSHNTFRENLSSRGSIDKFNYSLSVSRLDSDGISSAARGSENDPYQNTAVFSKLGYKIFDNSELTLVTHYTRARTAIDNGAYDDDPNDIAWWKDLTTKLAFNQNITSWWNHCLSFSYNDMRRKDLNGTDYRHPYDSFSDWYKGNTKKGEWQHNFSPVEWNTFTAGFEYEEESGSSFYESESAWGPFSSKQDTKSVTNRGYYFQDQLKLWKLLFITPGVRIDDNEMFGTETTYKISIAYLIHQTGTRLKGNWGTAFKAPSLYQLYSNYGDPNLKPDKSKGYDFGFEQYFFKNMLSFDLMYFHNDYKNMIDWDSSTWKYKNIGKAMTKGFEAGMNFLPLKNLTIGANFTFTDTENKETGHDLLRRPRRQAGLTLDWGFLPKANLHAGVTYVGKRKDVFYDSSTWMSENVTDKGYTTARLAASYDVTKNFQIFGRIENLFDKHYQEIYGYKTLGRSFYAGIKGSF